MPMRGIGIMARAGTAPSYRRRRFWRNTLLATAMAAAFFAGIGLWVAYGNSGSGFPKNGIPLEPNPPTPRTVKRDAKQLNDLHGIVKQFVMTAVARKHLAASYRLVGPALREGYSEKQWAAGNVTVVPYPVDKKTWLAFEKPDWSYARSVRFQVHVLTPDQPLHVAQAGVYDFFVDLLRVHGRWVVNNWVPRWVPPIPNSSG